MSFKKQSKQDIEIKKKAQADKVASKKINIKILGKDVAKNHYEELFFDNEDFVIDTERLKEDVKNFAPKMKIRTIDELQAEAEENLKEALSDVKFAKCVSDSFVLKDDNAELETVSERVDLDARTLKRILFDFAFIYGNYNANKKWINVPDTQYYLSLPKLLKQGKHSTLVILHLQLIAEKLKDVDNAFIQVLAKSKVVIKPNQRPFAFSKGHLLLDDKRKEILEDVNLVFSELKKPIDKRDFSKLKFFGL